MFCLTPYEFGWSADNFGSTYTDTGFAVNCPGNASAHAKGANTNLLNGIAFDAYAIAICFTGGATNNTVRKNLVDILVDPAAGVGNAGSSWTTKIANLLVNSASLPQGGYWYLFPLFIPAGTAIGGANQSHTGSTSALRVGIKVFGKPKRPDLWRIGTGVQSIGPSAGTTKGTTVTVASQAKGSWTIMGTVQNDSTFWYQAGLAWDDSSRASDAYLIDIAWSPDGGTTFVIIAENIFVIDTNLEVSGKTAMGESLPFRDVPAGYDLYVRATCTAATPPDNASICLYAVY